jgi:hypothetical protein
MYNRLGRASLICSNTRRVERGLLNIKNATGVSNVLVIFKFPVSQYSALEGSGKVALYRMPGMVSSLPWGSAGYQ